MDLLKQNPAGFRIDRKRSLRDLLRSFPAADPPDTLHPTREEIFFRKRMAGQIIAQSFRNLAPKSK